MATYKDLQRATGLSLATISKHYNGKPVRAANAAAIEEAAARLGFRVNPAARSLRAGRTRAVGVVLPALDNAFHQAIVAGIERRLRSAGLSLILGVSHGAEEPGTVDFLVDKGVDGIIAVPSPGDADALRAQAESGMPVVLVDWFVAGIPGGAVGLDNRAAGRIAALHLHDHGHRRVAVIGGPATVSSLRERAEGFETAFPGEAVVHAVPLTVEDGRRAATRVLFAERRPSAVFTANHELTLGALQAVADAGLVLGRDVSLIGFDAAEIAGIVSPRLTTIVQPTAALAEAAADQLLASIGGAARDHAGIRLDPELIPGGSVATVVDPLTDPRSSMPRP